MKQEIDLSVKKNDPYGSAILQNELFVLIHLSGKIKTIQTFYDLSCHSEMRSLDILFFEESGKVFVILEPHRSFGTARFLSNLTFCLPNRN